MFLLFIAFCVCTNIKHLCKKHFWNIFWQICLISEIHFITSKKGHQLLVYNTYTYAINCKSKNRTSWACSSRCSKRCNAQIVLTNENELCPISTEHSHAPPVFYVNDAGEYVRVNDRKLSQMNILNEEDLQGPIVLSETETSIE